MDRMVASEAIDLGSTPSEPILLLTSKVIHPLLEGEF